MSEGTQTPLRGSITDPEFRTERARRAGRVSQSAAGLITRFVNAIPTLTPEQIETVRRALPPVTQDGGR